MVEYNKDCRFFSGYKPCKFKRACKGCNQYVQRGPHIGIISLEALGAVLRSTCILAPIRRRYPDAHVTWITYPNALSLLENNPDIDRLVGFNDRSFPALSHLNFDRLYCIDKSFEAGGLAQNLNATVKLGFGIASNGAIVPLNPEADYLYGLGLDDHKKFFENQKAETQLTTESLALEWQRDEYRLHLTPAEQSDAKKIRSDFLGDASGILGFNTGCSTLYSYKKFTVQRSIEVIAAWRQQFPKWKVFLLGGREDSERQQDMKGAFADDPFVVNTPTNLGIRQGAVWIDACDLVFSGDSLGMHIAVSRQKPVIAWFGLSCEQEIDLYDRGIKLKSDVNCSPCWKKSCSNEPKCYDQVSVPSIIQSTHQLVTTIEQEK